MRFATLRTKDGTRAARLDADGRHATLLRFPDMAAALQAGLERVKSDQGDKISIEGFAYAPVVVEPRKIICVGMNYRKHIEEVGGKIPEIPAIFAKFPLTLIGPNDDLVLPPESNSIDWETELGFVIGRVGRHIPEESALDYIAGFTVCNDVSMRDWQMRSSTGPIQGKAWDRSCPVGPVLVTPDEVDGARDLRLQTFVDDVKMQDSRTSDMIFSPAYLVHYLSTFATLEPGDLILTGTPEGVGYGRKPQIFLKPGQTLRSSIEKLGELRNRTVAEG